MMSKELHNFFEAFGTEEPGITLPPSNPLQENARLLAMHYNETIKPGHGLFFDFSASPEYEKPVPDYLTQYFGWAIEKSFFIRKPDHLKLLN